jgi:thioesterase domain-containing protein
LIVPPQSGLDVSSDCRTALGQEFFDVDHINNPCRPEALADDAVARVWEKVLAVPAHRGDRLLDALAEYPGAVRSQKLGHLLSEIGTATGTYLPLSVAFASPTAAELSTMIRTRAWPRFDRPVEMQSRPGEPLFVLPGIGGIGLDALGLVRRLRFDGSVYLCPPRGIDGDEPDRALHEVVADHVARIKAVHPNGRYWLLGYSWGGLVALEIARALSEAGSTVAFIGMIDPVLNQIDWTYGAWLQYMRQRSSHHLKELRRLGSPRAVMRYAMKRVVPVVDKAARLFGFNKLWPLAEAGGELPAPLAAIWSAESEMIKAHRLRYYDGTVTLFATRSGHAAEVHPEKIWPAKVRQLDLRWMPGDHMLSEPEVEGSAKVISATLARRSDR